MNDQALESLLLSLDDALPTGSDLEYDPDSMELARAVSEALESAGRQSVAAVDELQRDPLADFRDRATVGHAFGQIHHPHAALAPLPKNAAVTLA